MTEQEAKEKADSLYPNYHWLPFGEGPYVYIFRSASHTTMIAIDDTGFDIYDRFHSAGFADRKYPS
jgi:hypothetical protein